MKLTHIHMYTCKWSRGRGNTHWLFNIYQAHDLALIKPGPDRTYQK